MSDRLVWVEVYLIEVDGLIALPYIPSYAALKECEKGRLRTVTAERAVEINRVFTKGWDGGEKYLYEKMRGRIDGLKQNMSDLNAEITALSQ